MMPRRCLAFVGLLALLSFALLHSPAEQTADKDAPFKEPPTEFECRWASKPIAIDGKGDDPAWKDAQVIDSFYLPWLKQPRAAKTATKARLLWDREYLYFLADMDDSDLYADIKEKDGTIWDNDVFELFFKPAADKPGYYEFQVNAAGTVMDMFLPRRGAGGYRRFKGDGDFNLEAKVTLRGTLNDWRDKDQGWTVEGRLPWKDFLRTGGRPEPGEKWKMNLARYDYSVDFEGPELSTCAPLKSLPYPDFHRFEDFATVVFVGPKKDAALPKRVPLNKSTVVGSPDPPLPYRAMRVYPQLKMNYPIAVTRQPDSERLLYITQPWQYAQTTIHRTTGDPATGESEALLKLDGVAYDIAFHPQFAKNGYVYIGWNGPSSGPKEAKKTKVTRYTIDPKPPHKFDEKSEKLIIEWPSDGHNGGAIAFGLDGMLYVTSGDGTSDSDTNVKGQGLDHLLAKVLRIDVDRRDEGKAYSVPKDNPFVDMKDARPETWAYGLRNPWRITVDAKTGHIWVGNNGQDLWEQAFLVRKGDNFGWSVMEGSHVFYPNRKPGPTPFVKPTVEHHHSEFRSLTGGIVYHGKKFPELQGAYIYGDHSTGQIWGVKHDGTKIHWHKQLAGPRMNITAFGVDAQGEVLICDHRGKYEGGLYTLEPTPKDLPASNFPRKLSDSGLFQSVKGHVMQPALVPYSVNAPLWSDGAHKERWLALPGADSKIDFTTWRGWNFPDETVLVKSFALELEEGNPASRRWIETRFLTKQQGEWFGYSYLWNDEQTEGTLVEAKGLDKEFSIRGRDGARVQKWRYPSRQECMVCHSRAANFVLGLTELQMNRDHDHGGVKCNQLEVLERLGMLRVNWADETKNRMREELKAKGLTDKQINEHMHIQTGTRGQREPVTSSLLSQYPEKYRKLADPYDAKGDVALRARSYLHANCAQCHVEAGGGNAAIDLEFTTQPDKMRLFGVKPLHHTFALPEAQLIAPAHPERSVLLRRLSHRDAGHMPPLATSVVDRQAIDLVRDWIKGMKEE